MGKMDGLGDYEGILTAVQNNTMYAAGFRKVKLRLLTRMHFCRQAVG